MSKTNKMQSMIDRYNYNKSVKPGTKIKCAFCGKALYKKQYSQVFCSPQCKDHYHNYTNVSWRHRIENFYTKIKIAELERNADAGMTDRDWDEAFGVAEYND